MTFEEFQEAVYSSIKANNLNPYRIAKDNGLPERAIKSVLEGTQPSFDRVNEICDALGLEFHIGLPEESADADLPEGDQIIPYLGSIAAGGSDDPNEARVYEAEFGRTIIAPPMITARAAKQHGGLHAANVSGDSMSPTYNDGDLVMFYPNDPQSERWETLIGKDCAVCLEDGDIFIKRLRRGDKQGTFNLESINPRWGVMTNQTLIKANPIRYIQRKV